MGENGPYTGFDGIKTNEATKQIYIVNEEEAFSYGGFTIESRRMAGTRAWEIVPKDGQAIPSDLQGMWLETRKLREKIDRWNKNDGV